MFIEFNEHPRDQLIETDICVIGAGAAGISIVHELRKSSLNICLLESGRLTTDMVHQRLKEPASREGDYLTAGCVLRRWGGTTNHWGGNSKPLDDIDFSQRDWVDYSGWPINKADLEPWYQAANELVGGGLYAYTRQSMLDADWPYPDFGLEFLEDVYWRASDNPTDFASIYRDDFEQAANVRVFLNATVTNLDANETAASVTTATIQSPEGNQARIRARFFIVAAGCMESSRMLLASNDVQPEGLGNQSDNVGRFFQMHPHVDIGRIVNLDERLIALLGQHRHGGARIIPGLSPSPASQEEMQMLNVGIQLQGIPDDESGYAVFRKAARELSIQYAAWKGGFDNELSDEFGDWVGGALTDIDSVIAGLWESYKNPRFTGQLIPGQANIYVQAEQAPNPDSRIYLSNEMDAMGVPRVIQDCRVLPIDKHSLRATGELLGRELGVINGGRVQLADWLMDDEIAWESDIWGGCHHMGTTRMSESPAAGVVDKNLKLHTIDNTYVASGSVFTTGGHANPTINIVALSLRLADHIKSIA